MPEAVLLGPEEALERHVAAWRELAVGRDSAFVTPEWFRSWLEHYGESATVRVAVVHADDGTLLGLMPFAIGGSGLIRSARIAGSILADYVHPVAHLADEATVARSAVAALAGAEPSWATLVLDNVDADSDWWRGLPGPGGAELRRRVRSESVSPFASLGQASFDDYLGTRSASFRKQLRRLDRRLVREATIQLRQTATSAELEADLATFFRLHFARWSERGGSSLQAGSARAFHETFAGAALQAGWLRLLVLEADGEPIAAFYGWRVGDRYAFYQAGFEESWSRFSVGLIMHGRIIERAIAEGASEYDMLLGAEPYKFRFCDSVRRVATPVLTRPRHPAGLAVAGELAARRIAGRLPSGMRGRLAALQRRLPTGRRR